MNYSASVFDYNPIEARGYYTKEQFKNYKKRVKVECYTNEQVPSCQNKQSVYFPIYDTKIFLGRACIPKSQDVSEEFGDLTSNVNDLIAAMWPIIGAVFLSLLFS